LQQGQHEWCPLSGIGNNYPFGTLEFTFDF